MPDKMQLCQNLPDFTIIRSLLFNGFMINSVNVCTATRPFVIAMTYVFMTNYAVEIFITACQC